MFYCVQGYIHRIARNCSASGKWASTLHWELSYFLSTQTWLHLHTSRWHATSAQQHTEGTGEPSTTRASLFLTDFLVCCVEKVLDSILFFDFAVLRALCRILTSTYHISSQISSTNYLAQFIDCWLLTLTGEYFTCTSLFSVDIHLPAFIFSAITRTIFVASLSLMTWRGALKVQQILIYDFRS